MPIYMISDLKLARSPSNLWRAEACCNNSAKWMSQTLVIVELHMPNACPDPDTAMRAIITVCKDLGILIGNDSNVPVVHLDIEGCGDPERWDPELIHQARVAVSIHGWKMVIDDDDSSYFDDELQRQRSKLRSQKN